MTQTISAVSFGALVLTLVDEDKNRGMIRKQENRVVRKLRCFQVGGFTAQEILDEFNDRREEFGVPDSDILSVNASPPTLEVPIGRSDGSTKKPKIEVVIVYWSDK
jgi:hypothetical protein